MANYNRIDKSTVIEMKEAREQGMTNRQIAELFGYTPATVRCHIGKQPVGIRANYGQYKQPKDAVREKNVAFEPVFTLKPLTQTFQSEHYSWLLDHVHGLVQFGNSPEQISKSKAEDIISALNSVMPYLRNDCEEVCEE